jgi:hypothetical protein
MRMEIDACEPVASGRLESHVTSIKMRFLVEFCNRDIFDFQIICVSEKLPRIELGDIYTVSFCHHSFLFLNKIVSVLSVLQMKPLNLTQNERMPRKFCCVNLVENNFTRKLQFSPHLNVSLLAAN